MINYINSKKDTKPDLNLKDMLEDNQKKYSFEMEEGFVVVSRASTVEEALSKMNGIKNCKDVFVTLNGKDKEEVLGWLPDTLMRRFLTTN